MTQFGNVRTDDLTTETVTKWLTGKLAQRLEVPATEIATDKYFDEFGLDSTEALVLSGELEEWLGFELDTTALWYHPTIQQLAPYIVEQAHGNTGGDTGNGAA
jgi:acyl carrier protein